jgi:hypothetical protein
MPGSEAPGSEAAATRRAGGGGSGRDVPRRGAATARRRDRASGAERRPRGARDAPAAPPARIDEAVADARMARGEECGRRKGRRKGRGAGGASREANVRHFFQGAIRSEAACVAPAWKGQPALRRGAPIRPSVDESIRLEDGPFVGAKRKADLAPSSKSRSLVCQTHDDTRSPTVRRRDAFPAARHLPRRARCSVASRDRAGRARAARRATRRRDPRRRRPSRAAGRAASCPSTSADARMRRARRRR